MVEVLEPDRAGEVVKVKDRLGDDRVIVVGRGDEEHVAHLAGAAARRPTCERATTCCSTPARAWPPSCCPKEEVEELVLEEIPDVSYEDIGGLEGQIDSIRDAVELPFLYAELFAEHELEAPKGVLLYGPPGLRQDPDRQGGREVARREGRRARGPRRRPQLLPQRQGPGAAQQVRRRDRAPDPRDLHPRQGAQRGRPAGHRVLRRDGFDLPHARHGHLERRRIDDRAAAAQRARRRRDPEERDRDRRFEPRGPDRPGHPAPWASRREDQDRAPEPAAGRRHHVEVPAPGRAHPPRRGRRATAAMPSRRATA